MRLLTPLGAILLTIAVCPRALYPQDSPIYLNDNGNIPLELGGQKGKAPKKAKKRRNRAKTPRWSLYETHIKHLGGIEHSPQTGEYYIELTKDYRPVCLELPDGNKIDLTTKLQWRLTSLSHKDNAVISSNGSNHIHIDPGADMLYNPPYDMDDPDQSDVLKGKKNQMIGARFNDTTYDEIRNKSFIIHYCGSNGCLDDKKTDQCADVSSRKNKTEP